MAPDNGPQETGRSLTRFYAILGVVAVVGLGAVGYSLVSGAAGGAVVEPVELEGVEDDRALFDLAEGVELGPADAPVVIHEFSDFECPACARFASSIKPLIEERLVETGKAKFVYFDFPLIGAHDHSFLAARAARCAGDQGRFWDYSDILFGKQFRWAGSSNPAARFVDYAGELGLDAGEFEACVESDRYADVVSANLELAKRLGVNATPTVFVNGKRIVNFRGYGDIEEVVRTELEGK